MLKDWDREVVGAILLDRKNTAIGHVIAYIGTQMRTAVEPRGFLVPALLANAAAMILFHNHPGGGTSPSKEDKAFCERLAQAADVTGLVLLDSIIVTPEGPWMSMRELGMVPEGEKAPKS